MAESNPDIIGGNMYFNLACSATERKDYGSALYLSHFAKKFYRDGNADSTILDACNKLQKLIGRGMENEFLQIAQKKGLTVTDDNFDSLFREHCPSLEKYEGIADLAGEFFGQLRRDPKRIVQTLSEWVNKIKIASKNSVAAKYLGDNSEILYKWEPWKGDPEIDLEEAYQGLEAIANQDIIGELDEALEAMRVQLDNIRKFRTQS